MLDLRLQSVSIVILSGGNNPRLLNPDFLERNSIVSKEWAAANVIVTPPLAIVEYTNGVKVQLEEQKVQFLCSRPSEFPWGKDLPALATRFLDVLPHVSYRAVGLNYTVSSDDPKGTAAEDQVINRFLQQGAWQSCANGLTGVNLELQFKTESPHISLKLGARQDVSTPSAPIIGYVFIANFHHDFSPEERAERNEFIGQLQDRFSQVTQLVNMLPLDSQWPSHKQ